MINSYIYSNPRFLTLAFFGMMLVMPFPSLRLYGIVSAMLFGTVFRGMEGSRRYDVMTYRYVVSLLLGKAKNDAALVYCSMKDEPENRDHIRYDGMVAFIAGLTLFYLSPRLYEDMIWRACIIYIAMFLSMVNFPTVKRWRRYAHMETLIWHSDHPCNQRQLGSILFDQTPYGYIVWQIPAVIYNRIKPNEPLHLVSCPSDATQAPLASAISERRVSLYLVSTDAVIPVCYNPEENEQAIEQLRTETFQRNIPLVTLDENPMPVPAKSGALALWAVCLLAGFYFLLGQLYHLAHGNPQVTKQILPLISFLCTWGVLEVYSLVLRHKGQSSLRKAAGL